MEYPSVGIGILNWNGKKFLEQFLDGLQHLTYPNYTIYVIDNDSSDDSLWYVEAEHPAVKIIKTGENLGFAGGYNYAFARMPEIYVLMLNSDVDVTPGFLEPLVTLMEKDKTIAATQPKILAYHQKNFFEHAGAAGGMMDFLGYSFCRGRIFDTIEKDENQYKTGEVFWVSGACSLIRKSAFAEIGGMDTYFFMHFEEIDMCWRFLSKGYKNVYCNESAVYHVGGGTLAYNSPKKTYYNFRNNIIMSIRNAPAVYLLWWLPARFFLDQLAVVKFLSARDFKNAWAVERAYGGVLRWFFGKHREIPPLKKSLQDIPVVLKKSIIWLYYIKKKKQFSKIKAHT